MRPFIRRSNLKVSHGFEELKLVKGAIPMDCLSSEIGIPIVLRTINVTVLGASAWDLPDLHAAVENNGENLTESIQVRGHV